ncbi:MAG: protein kinase [Bryobacteraceae bacterium]|jgi:serine/threonine-protein kinase
MGLETGFELGEYRILSRVGAGAWGEVYEAEHIITRRIDAIKLMTRRQGALPDEEHRFLREIQVQASLQHPNLAAVYHAFWTSHGLALVMERIHGQSLSAILERGPVPLVWGVHCILGVLSGLAYAHLHGVVHRDIKPENIVVTPDNVVKLTDFGVAQFLDSPRITQSGEFVGSPCYMSPEQAVGTAAVDARSDIYSTGVVLYEIVTGRLPFEGTGGYAQMLAHQTAAPVPPMEIDPSIDPRLNDVILRALAKDPAGRFQTAAMFQQALAEAMAPAAPAGSLAPPVSAPRRLWRRAAVAGALAAALCGAVGASRYLALMHRPVPDLPLIVRSAVPAPPDSLLPSSPGIGDEAAAPGESPADVDDAKPSSPPSTRRQSNSSSRLPAHARSNALTFSPPAEAEPAARQPSTAPPTWTGAELPPPPEVSAGPSLSQSPSLPPELAEEVKPAAVKRHNPVVRALGKIFGKREKPAGNP